LFGFAQTFGENEQIPFEQVAGLQGSVVWHLGTELHPSALSQVLL